MIKYTFRYIIKYLFNDIYDVSHFQLQLVLVHRQILKQHFALSLLRLCEKAGQQTSLVYQRNT